MEDDKDELINGEDIETVEITLLSEQFNLILRALELYGYNLEYMLNSSSSITQDDKDEKLSMLKYTYEHILSIVSEQINKKAIDYPVDKHFIKNLRRINAEDDKIKVISDKFKVV